MVNSHALVLTYLPYCIRTSVLIQDLLAGASYSGYSWLSSASIVLCNLALVPGGVCAR